jgi:hypothetical protein
MGGNDFGSKSLSERSSIEREESYFDAEEQRYNKP